MKKFFSLVLCAALLWSSMAGAAELTLLWQDNANNEEGFNVERGPTESGPFTRLTPALSANVTTFVDTGLAEATQYCYRVDAFNSAGESTFAGPACGTTRTTLTVAKSGTGSGTITSNPSGVACGAQCSGQVPGNSTITLIQTATTGSVFAGWGGACSGVGACSVVMNGPKTVTAAFNILSPPQAPVTLNFSGTCTFPGDPCMIIITPAIP